MNYTIKISSDKEESFWKDWHENETPNCSYSPSYTLNTNVNQNKTEQVINWDIFYDKIEQ